MKSYEEIRESINSAWYSVFKQARKVFMKNQDFFYIPLFFIEESSDEIIPSEIETSGTSLGISILSRSSLLDTPEEKDVFKKCINLIKELQTEPGGWASVTPIASAYKIKKMEGTINSSFFALDSLFNAGLPTFHKEITDLNINEQLDMIREGLQWLLNNTIGKGWYYLEREYIRKKDMDIISPAIFPTSNIIILFKTAEGKLKKINNEMKKHEDCYDQIMLNKKIITELREQRRISIKLL